MNFRFLILKIASKLMVLTHIFHQHNKKNILIFRCGGLGDFLLETITIHRLREYFPQGQYKIFYVHRQLNAETITKIIPVDQVIIFNEKSFFHIILTAISIWKRRYSLLINMSDPRYPLMHRVIGMCRADKRIAYDYPRCRFTENEFEKFRKEYDIFLNFSWEKDHVMTMTLKLLRELTGKNFSLPEHNDYTRIHEKVSKENSLISQPYIAFSLFGSGENHNLPDKNGKDLLLYCLRKFRDCKLVIVGATKDRDHAQNLINSLPECADKIINFCGKSSYCDLYNLAKNAKFMIGIDTGTTHFGALFAPHTFVLVRKHLPELFWPYPEKFMANITIITAEQCQCDTQCLQCLRKGIITPCMECLQTEHIIKSIEETIG